MASLKDLRKRKGLRQEDMAEKLGMTQSTYSALENGHVAKYEKYFEKLSKVLSVDRDEIEKAFSKTSEAEKRKYSFTVEMIDGCKEFRVSDGSMAPRLMKGDILLYKEVAETKPSVGDMVIINYNGDTIVREYKKARDGNEWYLCLNPDYENVQILSNSADGNHGFSLVGIVQSLLRPFQKKSGTLQNLQ